MRFERVSYSAYADDVRKHFSETIKPEKLFGSWNNIKIPERKTKYSAGYDICCPLDISIAPHSKIVVPTGIRAVFAPDEMESWHLQMYVRSSIGNKGLVLASNVAVIDSDYALSPNEGDIMMPMLNVSDEVIEINSGDRICQGVFTLHGLVTNDKAENVRKGGMGSTGK